VVTKNKINMKKYLILLMGMFINSAAWSQLLYPKTRQIAHEDVYHGVSVADPYRWLEDDNSEETKEWVKAQNKVSFGYLETLPLRETFKKRIEQLSNYEKYQRRLNVVIGIIFTRIQDYKINRYFIAKRV